MQNLPIGSPARQPCLSSTLTFYWPYRTHQVLYYNACF
jgi:hypothetical protein